MPLFDMEPGDNPRAPGRLLFGIEGLPEVFTLDTAGNLTIAGTLTAAGGGGGGGDATLGTAQTFTATKTFQHASAALTAIVLNCAAVGQTADLVQAYSGTDTGEGGARQRTFYLNEKGELRVIAAKGNSVAVRIKGQPTQTVDIFQITDTGNNPVSVFNKSGHLKGPNVGHIFAWSANGNLSVVNGAHRLRNITGVDLDFRSLAVQLGTAPTGAAATFSFRLNGSAITAADVSVAAGSTDSAIVTAFTTAVWPAGQSVAINVTGIGSGTAGADPVVQLMAA